MATNIILGIISLQLGCISYQLLLLYRKSYFDPTTPTNVYGENLSEGIQNAIVRGQRGISTYD